MKQNSNITKCINSGFIIFMMLIFQSCSVNKIFTGDKAEKKNVPVFNYVDNISPLFAQKCTPCHFPERGRKKMLNTYIAVKENIDDILHRVQLSPDHKEFMPFKSKKEPLTESELNQLKTWVSDGMPE